MSQRQKKLDLMSGKLGIMQIKNTFMKNIKFFKKTNKKKKIIYYLWIFKRNTYKYNFTDFDSGINGVVFFNEKLIIRFSGMS